MDVKVFTVLFWACATWQMSVNANAGCIYEGRQLKKGSYPFETHANTDTEEKCKDICDSDPLCVIWQWQPTQKNCWIIYVDFKRDANSDFGINNCNEGKPTENAPECKVEKGNREHKLKNHWRMTREECIAICSEDSDCLIWQYFRKERLCQIHKLEVDTTKKSQVGIHYCSSSAQSTCTSCNTCGVTDNASSRNGTLSRIAGGVGINWNAFPYVVLLNMYLNGVNVGICTGSFINGAMHILTAAHCVYNSEGRLYTEIHALIGLTSSSNQAVGWQRRVRICNIYPHPSYKSNFGFSDDIAVLQVCPEHINTNIMSGVRSLCLPPHHDPDFYGRAYEGIEVQAVGYGTSALNNPNMNDLRIVALITEANANCEARFVNNFPWKPYPSADQICATGVLPGSGNCRGDSGGPLVINVGTPPNDYYVQIGVTSLGGCNSQGGMDPTFFTRVSVHRDFIQHYTRNFVQIQPGPGTQNPPGSHN